MEYARLICEFGLDMGLHQFCLIGGERIKNFHARYATQWDLLRDLLGPWKVVHLQAQIIAAVSKALATMKDGADLPPQWDQIWEAAVQMGHESGHDFAAVNLSRSIATDAKNAT